MRALAALFVVILSFPALAETTPPPTPPAPTTQEGPPSSAPSGVVPPAPPTSAAAPAAPGGVLTFKGLELRISGVIFASWQYRASGPDGQDQNGSNAFELNRAYVNVEPRLAKNIWLRITPDITRTSGTGSTLNGSLALRLKYGYAQFNEVLPGMSARAGLQQTAWIDFEESVWQYRVIAPTAFELFGANVSSDLGVGVLGSAAGGVVGYQAVLDNGEGFTQPENPDLRSGKFKDVGARLTLVPFAHAGPDIVRKLALTVFGQYGFTTDPVGPVGPRQRSRAMAMASWENRFFTLAVSGGPMRDDVAAGTTRHEDLISVFGFVNLPLDFRVIGRFDHFDPGKGVATGSQTRAIGGLAYVLTSSVQFIADYQSFGYATPQAAPAVAPGQSFFLHMEAKY